MYFKGAPLNSFVYFLLPYFDGIWDFAHRLIVDNRERFITRSPECTFKKLHRNLTKVFDIWNYKGALGFF